MLNHFAGVNESNSKLDTKGVVMYPQLCVEYFSRKGSYAINVQVIVDMRKQVLWRHIGEMGSSHDSPIFHESKLGRYMEGNVDELKQKGIFLVGDSAYSLRSYLMTPYNNPGVKTAKDNFNFYLSSCRIYVECCN